MKPFVAVSEFATRVLVVAVVIAASLSWMSAPVHAASVATKAECQAACLDRIAACNEQCSEFGSTARECRRNVLRTCRRSGVSACVVPPVLPCGYDGPFPAPESARCGGTCPDGLTCTTFPDPGSHAGILCFCMPPPEWQIPCGIATGPFQFCGGPCPAELECKGFGSVRGNVCLCIPRVLGSEPGG